MDTPIIPYDEVKTPKLMTPAERRKQRRLEIAEAKRLADALLEKDAPHLPIGYSRRIGRNVR